MTEIPTWTRGPLTQVGHYWMRESEELTCDANVLDYQGGERGYIAGANENFYPDFLRDGYEFYGPITPTTLAAVRAEVWIDAAQHVRSQWLDAYPVEVFPDPPDSPAECARDLIAAYMGRHMATRLIEEFETRATTTRDGEQGKSSHAK